MLFICDFSSKKEPQKETPAIVRNAQVGLLEGAITGSLINPLDKHVFRTNLPIKKGTKLAARESFEHISRGGLAKDALKGAVTGAIVSTGINATLDAIKKRKNKKSKLNIR